MTIELTNQNYQFQITQFFINLNLMEQQKLNNENENINLDANPLYLYSSDIINEDNREKLLKEFYIPLDIQYCGFHEQIIDKSAIVKKKKQLNKPFSNENISNTQSLLINDGIYQMAEMEKFDTMNISRLEMRLNRDVREQFYKSNGELVFQDEFFHEQVSRLVNISFQDNPALAIYQKNAILSERSNQKKNQPFEIQLIVGQIKFLKHEFQSEQQKKFEEIRPVLQELEESNAHPVLPHLQKVLQVLKQKHSELINSGAPTQILNNYKKEIEKAKDQYDKQIRKLQSSMKKILQAWKEIKQIRRTTGIVNVPWRIIIKQYIKDGKQQYEIGLGSIGVTQKIAQDPVHRAQIERRNKIQEQKYFVKLIINNIVVATSSKFNLQWPNYTIQVYEKFVMHVYTMPASVKLQIIKDGYIEKSIDTINLKLPGQFANTITSSEKRYISEHFATNGDKVRKKKQAPEGSVGIINYKIEWKGQKNKMPPSSIIFADQSTQDVGSSKETEQEQSLIDINDPRKIKEKKQIEKKIGIVLQKGKKESLIPFGNLISIRQILLKLRGKTQRLQGKIIPLTNQKIKKNLELLQIIQQEKTSNTVNLEANQQKIYHPLEGIFRMQPQDIKQKIKQILIKIISNHKHVTTSVSISSYKYKLVDQIVNQYSFEQMVSPIVIFFKDLFTQKRKLGPKISHTPLIRQNIVELEIIIHINSGNNIPIRESSIMTIGKYRKTRQEMLRLLNAQQMGFFSGYGPTFFQQQPNLMSQNYPYFNNYNNQMEMGYQRGGYNNPIGSNINTRGTGFGGNINNGYGGANMMGTGYGGMNPGGYGGGGNMMGPGYGGMNPIGAGNPRGGLSIDYNNENPNQILSKIERVKSFIEIRFRKQIKRTNDFEGISPEWNESITFNYNLKRDNSSIQQNFYSNQKFINLTLFDMVQQSKPTRAINQLLIKKTKYFLGSIDIPLSTLIAIPRLSGMFKVNKPLINFGYTLLTNPLLGAEDNQPKIENPTLNTYVSLDFSFNPQIQASLAYNNDRKFNIGQQNSLLLQHANDWIQALNIKRYIRLWLNNLQGNSIFISRYLNQIEPPPFRTGLIPQNWIQRTARFVSLIPHKSSCKLLDNTEEYHLKCQQFLDLKMGDDHAILLCNYFNSIDKIQGRLDIQSYLIIGKGFPQGKTMYVLRRDKKTQQYEIWNPRTGDPYCFQKDVYQTVCCCFTVHTGIKTIQITKDICPLLEVGCIVSKDNVYLNIQESMSPGDISYQLENQKYWKPFLTQRSMIQFFNKKPVPPYQQNNQITKEFYELKADAKEIEHLVFDFIREKIKTDRKNHPIKPYSFQINTEISNDIRDQMLLKLETLKFDYRVSGIESKLYSEKQKAAWINVLDQLKKLKNKVQSSIETDKKFYGFPINFTYTTPQDAWEKVIQTQIHMTQKQDIQFVLTVRTFAQPCYITSVWIFLGIIQ